MTILLSLFLFALFPLQALGLLTTPDTVAVSRKDDKGRSEEVIVDLVAVVIALLALPLTFGRTRRWVASVSRCMLAFWTSSGIRTSVRQHGPVTATQDLLRYADE
ncbi:hypothetical protein SVAN01_00226 [Stagonosporopsis vannaccii]|nr:hypothetical protein SVAN01_00226 [Stagonosporopsis vannaccii]